MPEYYEKRTAFAPVTIKSMAHRRWFDLEPHGSDTFVGEGPQYPWGGLYGGQIVAQALRAAAATVDPDLQVHSLRAYFIRRGDHTEPVRYEVDRIRDGRSFATRRVVARQAVGAILNCEASFQRDHVDVDMQFESMPPGIPEPETLESGRWTDAFDRRVVEPDTVVIDGVKRARSGGTAAPARHSAWLQVSEPVGDDYMMNCCWLAYLSDDVPTDSVVRAYRHVVGPEWEPGFAASLDHTIWFHRPSRADQWHLYDFTSSVFVNGRGLATGKVFSRDGVHVATVAQEVLLRGTFPVGSTQRPD